MHYCRSMHAGEWVRSRNFAMQMRVNATLLVCLLGSTGAKPRPTRSPVHRLAHEYRAVLKEGASLHHASDGGGGEDGAAASPAVRLGPVPNNLLEWHFSFSGLPQSDYEGGVYHGRFLMTHDYPHRAPRVQLLTPSGRFQTLQDICLSASAYHQETWSTHWSLHKLALALRLHMVTRATEVGGIERSVGVRRALASKSRRFRCFRCSTDHAYLVENDALADLLEGGDTDADDGDEDREIT